LSAIKLLGAAALPHRPPLPMAASDTAPPLPAVPLVADALARS